MIGKRRKIRARWKTGTAIAATAILSSGCATDGLASLPLPAPGLGGGGYQLTAVFSNALNLPMNAKVKLAGADVGEVESMVARNYTAVTTLRIRNGVLLPRGSTAELRTATPLGDVFVSVKPPTEVAPNAPMLTDGDSIGLESTAAAATVESVLSSAAILVNGGAVRNFTNIINGFGKATGNQGQAFGELIRKANQLLRTMDSRSGQLSSAMTDLSRLSKQLDEKNQVLSELMAAANPSTNALAANTTQISNLVVQLGDTSRLLARFPSLGGTDTSGRSLIRDLNTVAGVANDAAISPDTSWRSINRLMPPLIKSTAGNAISVNASVEQLVLGAIPDIGFPGDRGFHAPNRFTWNELIGSLKYTLFRLQERVVGRGPESVQVPVIPDPNVPGGLLVGPGAGQPPTPPAPGLPGPLPPGPAP